MLARAGERHELGPGRSCQRVPGRPALEHPKERRSPQVLPADLERRREGRDQILAQTVQEPAFVAGRALVVSCDRAQLPGDLAVGEERPQPLEPVKRDQARDPGVLGVVLLLGRTAPARDEVRVHRNDHVACVDESLHEQAVAGLDHHPHLDRVVFEPGDPCHQRVDRLGVMLHAGDIDYAFAGAAQSHQVELSDQSIPIPSTSPPFVVGKRIGRRRGVVLMDQSSWDDTLVDVGPPRPFPGDAVSRPSPRDTQGKRSPRKTSRGEGRAISKDPEVYLLPRRPDRVPLAKAAVRAAALI